MRRQVAPSLQRAEVVIYCTGVRVHRATGADPVFVEGSPPGGGYGRFIFAAQYGGPNFGARHCGRRAARMKNEEFRRASRAGGLHREATMAELRVAALRDEDPEEIEKEGRRSRRPPRKPLEYRRSGG